MELKPSPVQDKAHPVRLSGQAEVQVVRADGGGGAEGMARVVLERVPVSYTHLDVYKRQDPGVSEWGNLIEAILDRSYLNT